MKFLIRNKKYEFDLLHRGDREKALQFFKFRNEETMPFLNSLLCVFSKIKGFEELDAEIIKRELKAGANTGESFEKILEDIKSDRLGEGAFAFTYFDPIDNFFNIRVNWELIENTHEANPEFISFILLHQICHSYFGHFTREAIQNYRDRNGLLTEKVLDAQVNSFLIRALGYKKSADMYKKKTYEFVKEKFVTFESLFEWADENYDIKADFDMENDYPSIVSILGKLDPLFDKDELVNMDQLGYDMDSHNASMFDTNSTAEDLNKPVSQLAKIQADSMEYLQDVAKSEGIMASDAFARLTKSEYATKSVLEIVKLKTILGAATKARRKKTYRRVNKRRTYPGEIPMKGKVPHGTNHIVVGVDVSGSVSQQEVDLIKSHVKTFARRHKEDVIIDFFVWSSGTIVPERDLVENISDKKLDEHEFYSYGGTQISYVNDFIAEHYQGREIVFVNVTDGYYTHYAMPTDIITDHYGILTVEGMCDTYESMHKLDNLKGVEVIRSERRDI